MTSLLRHIYANARRHAAAEDGVIAILTLGFMIALGFMLIVTLWSIAYATGAYNELYAGTQAAAYAAVGQTLPTNGGNQAQLAFDCGPAPPAYSLSDGATACVGGGVMETVDSVFTASFPPAQCGGGFSAGFGLTWSTNSGCSTISLLDANGNPSNYVEAFYIPLTPGGAQGLWRAAGQPSCPYFTSQAGMPTELVCWGANDLGLGSSPGVGLPHFTSGVIVRTGVSVKLPGCSPVFCPVYNIRLAVAAVEGQP